MSYHGSCGSLGLVMFFPVVAFSAEQSSTRLSSSPTYGEYCRGAAAAVPETAETPFGKAVASVAGIGVEALRRVLSSITASLTALGNRANLLFAQVAAALAYDRAIRDMAAAFSGWQVSRSLVPHPAAGFWPMQPASQAASVPFEMPPLNPWLGNYWAANTWIAFEQACDFWMRLTGWFLLFGYPMRQNLYHQPQTMAASAPGFGWSFSWRAPFAPI